jgi:hypothetical protein
VYPHASRAAARDPANDALHDADHGGDPATSKAEERAAETFAELAHEYVERHAKKKRSAADESVRQWNAKCSSSVKRLRGCQTSGRRDARKCRGGRSSGCAISSGTDTG